MSEPAAVKTKRNQQVEKAQTPFDGLMLLTATIFSDLLGAFCELWRDDRFNELLGPNIRFVQDNISWSRKGTLRGLHFQKPPFEQGKLVFVPSGSVFDVAVDVRRGSPTFGQHFHVELSGDNKRMLWVSPGFAHGFLVLSDNATVLYKTTCHYAPGHECAIHWKDADLEIPWSLREDSKPLVSAKDESAPPFMDIADCSE